MNHHANRRLGRGVLLVAMALAPVLSLAAGLMLCTPTSASASPRVTPSVPIVAPTLPRVSLPGSLHPEARAESDVGRMNPDDRLTGMSVLFRESPAQSALLRRTLAAIENPASPRYHQWLSPEQVAAQFGASPTDMARVASWLTSRGLSVDGPSRIATRLAFGGTVAQIERAFATEMHHYRVRGATHFAMGRAPSVPAELADVILGLHGLHDFRAAAPPHRVPPQYALPIPVDGGTLQFPIMAPADFAKIYDLDSLYAAGIQGAGQSIAIAGRSDFNDADLAAFRAAFNLPVNPPVRILVPGSGPAVVTGPDDLAESELDLEWAGAVAPGAAIDFVFTGDSRNDDVFDALAYAVEQRVAPVLSISFGQCEAEFTASDVGFLEAVGDAANLEGMTVLAASGDTGAAGCENQTVTAAARGERVLFPASIPSVVAVGGSQFQITPGNQSTYLDPQLDALSYIPESGWNETLEDIDAGFGGLGAAGGGVSSIFAKPYWQVSQTPNDGFRDVPDVALSASADTLPYAVSMSWTAPDGDAQAPQPQALTAFGGTSAAAPSFAGILALLNQAIAGADAGAPAGLGNANPILYALAGSTASATVFHDVTTGDNVVPCVSGSPDCPASPPFQFGYAASVGYDQVTGLGTIDAANLVAAWRSLAPTSTMLQITAAGTTEGSTLELEATVASGASAMAPPMAGTVTFYFETLADGGLGSTGSLGAIAVSPSTSVTQGGTASLEAKAPGGFDGSGVRVWAFYGGDTHYLASSSLPSPVRGTSDLAICPTGVTLATTQTGFTFKTAGGVPPIAWHIRSDGTCAFVRNVAVCSNVDPGGVFTAGPKAGLATVVAVDAFDSYVTAEVTVTEVDGAAVLPVVACEFEDGGADGGDASDAKDAAPAVDATVPDASTRMDADSLLPLDNGNEESGKGCGCRTASRKDEAGTWEGWTVGALFTLAVVARRRGLRPRRSLSRLRPRRPGTPGSR